MTPNDNTRADIAQLRELVTDGHSDIIQRLSVIETHMYDLVGNGQPGRIRIVENKVSTLERFKYTALGYAAAVASVASILTMLIVAIVENHMHF